MVAKKYADSGAIESMPATEQAVYLKDLDKYANGLVSHLRDVEAALQAGKKAREEGGAPTNNMVGKPISGMFAAQGGSPQASQNLPPAQGGEVGESGYGLNRGIGSSGGAMFGKMESRLAPKPDIRGVLGGSSETNFAPASENNFAPAPSNLPAGQSLEFFGRQIERQFVLVQHFLADFEQLKPLFSRVPQTLSETDGFSYDELKVLKGVSAEELNSRLQDIQATARAISDPISGRVKEPVKEVEFLGLLLTFVIDMKAHSHSVRKLFADKRSGLGETTVIPAALGKAPLQDAEGSTKFSSSELKKLVDSFVGVLGSLKKFGETVEPRFGGINALVVNKAKTEMESALLTQRATREIVDKLNKVQQRLDGSIGLGMGPRGKLGGDEVKQLIEDVERLNKELEKHCFDVTDVMDRLGVEKVTLKTKSSAFGGGDGAALQRPPGFGGASAPSVNRPAAFGGGAGVGSSGRGDPTSEKINSLFKKVDGHMQKFETVLAPLFRKVPAAQQLRGKMGLGKH